MAVEIDGKAPDASAFLQDPTLTATLLTDLSQFDLNVIAEYPVEIECGGRTYQSRLTVVDKTAPTALPVAVTALAWRNAGSRGLCRSHRG